MKEKKPVEAEVINTDAVAVVKQPPPAPVENKPQITAALTPQKCLRGVTRTRRRALAQITMHTASCA